MDSTFVGLEVMGLAYLDFDYIIVSNQCYDTESLRHIFSFFAQHGIRKFVFLYNFDPLHLSLSFLKE